MVDISLKHQSSPDKNWLERKKLNWKESFGHLPSKETELELVQRRIYLLPTLRGCAVIVVVILLILVGINYQLSLAYVVAFLLAGLMQVALHSSYRNLRGAIVRIGKSPRCVAGETLHFSMTVSSPDRMREGIALARSQGKASERRKAIINAQRLRMAANTQVSYMIAAPAPTRGTVALGRMIIESRAPYGVIRAWSYAHFDWVGLIEPAPEYPYPELPHAVGDEATHTKKVDVAHDPDSLREYVPGDSLKRVAWKQVAKSGDWYTRTGESGQRGDIDLRWDATQLTDTEARLSRIAAWIDRARNENAAFSLELPNGSLPLADSAPHHDAALALLATFPTPPGEVSGVRL